MCFRGGIMNQEWYHSERLKRQCIALAELLLSQYPGATLCPIGQSMAWPVVTASLLTKVSTIYVPFSDRFYAQTNRLNLARIKSVGRITQYELNHVDDNRPHYELNYRKFLHTLQMDPLTIIKRHQLGRKTILLDYAQGGGSIVSFLSVLFEYARAMDCIEELKKAVEVVLITEKGNKFKTLSIEKTLTLECKSIQLDLDLIQALANSKEDSGKTSDRVVPLYPHYFWGKKPLPLTNQDNQAYITKQLETAILQCKNKPAGVQLIHSMSGSLLFHNRSLLKYSNLSAENQPTNFNGQSQTR